MARVLGVSKAGYYAWLQRPPSAHATADAALLKRIKTVHASSRQTYGGPRVHADLRGRGERHSRKRIARLMREAGLVAPAIGTAARQQPGGTGMTGLRPTWSTATSAPPDRTSCGLPTSLTCRRCGLPLSRRRADAGAARSSAGRWRTTCVPNWCWTRWRWRLANGGPRTSSTTATKAASIRRWHLASGVARQVFDHRWGRSVTPTTTPWPRVSSPPSRRAAQPSPVRISGRGEDGLL